MRGTTIPEGRSTSSWAMSFAKDTVFAMRCEKGHEFVESWAEETKSIMEHAMGGGE